MIHGALPVWFRSTAAAVDEWARRHPGVALPVSSSLRDTAAAQPLSVARLLLRYLRARGIQSTYGELPREQLAAILRGPDAAAAWERRRVARRSAINDTAALALRLKRIATSTAKATMHPCAGAFGCNDSLTIAEPLRYHCAMPNTNESDDAARPEAIYRAYLWAYTRKAAGSELTRSSLDSLDGDTERMAALALGISDGLRGTLPRASCRLAEDVRLLLRASE
jgi:hypothetical protein